MTSLLLFGLRFLRLAVAATAVAPASRTCDRTAEDDENQSKAFHTFTPR